MSKYSLKVVLLIIIVIIYLIVNYVPLKLEFIVPELDTTCIRYRMDETTYSRSAGLSLTPDKEQELISTILDMKFKRGIRLERIHEDRTVSFSLLSPRLWMYFYLNICMPGWSGITINGTVYKISKEDAIKLLRYFNADLPLDADHSRCFY